MHKYSINVAWSDEDECYIATIPEFTGLSAFGDSAEDAIQEAYVALEGFLEVYKEDNVPLPKPKTYVPHSGQTRLRLPKSLHANLVEEAREEGVSLNTYIINILAKRHEQITNKVLLYRIEEIHDSVLTLCRKTLESVDEPKTESSNLFEYLQIEGKEKGMLFHQGNIASSTSGYSNLEFSQNLCVTEL